MTAERPAWRGGAPLLTRLLVASSLLFFGCLHNRTCGQPPSLVVEGIGREGVRMRATAAAADHLTLEGSFDLRVWFRIQSAATVNGGVQFLHSNSIPAEAVFYRVRTGAPPEPAPIVAHIDSTRSAGGLITPEAGGRISLTSAGGLRFDFAAPTNSVREPVAVRMTLITNFTAFPANDGFRAAVMLEPEGLDFMVTARLTITFPEALPAEDMAG